MSRRFRWIVGLAVGIATLFSGALEAQSKLHRKVEVSAEIVRELFELPDSAPARHLEKEADCIAVIPHIVKGAFWVGGRHGNGVISCQDGNGSWSPPAFINLSGGSIGIQFGGEVTDLVLFFMTKRGVESLLKSKFTLGADASVAAGPVGRSAEVATDLRVKAEIYSYAKSRGLFAGLALDGARIAINQKAINRFYGDRLWPEQILFEDQVLNVPTEAWDLISALESRSGP